MDGTVFLWAMLVWAAMIPYFIVQGGLRNSLLMPRIGELRAHQVSSVTGSIAVFVAAWLFLLSLDQDHYTATGMTAVGVLWVGLTALFEFGFGHYIIGHPWEKLLADYDVTRGRLWVIVLASTLIAPPLMALLTDS